MLLKVKKDLESFIVLILGRVKILLSSKQWVSKAWLLIDLESNFEYDKKTAATSNNFILLAADVCTLLKIMLNNYASKKVSSKNQIFWFWLFASGNLDTMSSFFVMQEHIANPDTVTLAKKNAFVCPLEKLKNQCTILNSDN